MRTFCNAPPSADNMHLRRRTMRWIVIPSEHSGAMEGVCLAGDFKQHLVLKCVFFGTLFQQHNHGFPQRTMTCLSTAQRREAAIIFPACPFQQHNHVFSTHHCKTNEIFPGRFKEHFTAQTCLHGRGSCVGAGKS